MARSFYHFLLKYRMNKPTDEIAAFANAAYDDHSFPKQSTDYYELTDYLELNAAYLPTMAVFDQAWDLYKLNE